MGFKTALNDLEVGSIGLVIKLFPVISWLTRSRPKLLVAMQVSTDEKLGIAFAKDNIELCNSVNEALEMLHRAGEFDTLFRHDGFPSEIPSRGG